MNRFKEKINKKGEKDKRMFRFKRFCKQCEQLFRPAGKFCDYCDNCYFERRTRHKYSPRTKKGKFPKP